MKVKQNEKTEECFKGRNKKKPLKKTTSETEKNNLPDKEFKTLVIRMLAGLGTRIDKHSENFKRK